MNTGDQHGSIAYRPPGHPHALINLSIQRQCRIQGEGGERTPLIFAKYLKKSPKSVKLYPENLGGKGPGAPRFLRSWIRH